MNGEAGDQRFREVIPGIEMSAELQKRYFNVDEYYLMVEAGVLKPDDRVELIEGEVIKMSPIGSPHAACVSRLNRLLQTLPELDAIVAVQNPVRLNQLSEPVPDLALLQPRKDFYAERHPVPADVLLIIEVGDTTALADRAVKLPLYARSGIREVWLVNLPQQLIEVFSEPADGGYQTTDRYQSGETVVANTIAGVSLAVNEILG